MNPTPATRRTQTSPAQTGGEVPDWLARPAGAVEQVGPRVVPVAFAARVSTDDQQDPTLSLPRQLAACQRGLPDGMVIVAYFYDIESGRTDLDQRGHGTAHTKFELPIPRDGGIDELLAEAKRSDRRFDAVICESVDRLARITYYGTKIEHELEQAGVLLLASDEPQATTQRRATAVLTRRMKQGIAEWYVLDMLEKAWGGFEIHTRQGWNVGRAPYGYVADCIPHPVPARRAEGKHKTRLAINEAEAVTVRAIFDLRIGQRVSYRQIAEQLNGDLALYPPPVPTDPARAVGRWTGSTVREILHNPKYTGHMVWNRKARKKGGKVNPVTEWVLSEQPTHPAIITTDQFAAAAAVARHRERSKSGSQPNQHPATRHTYTLRSYVRCANCGRRMFGKMHRTYAYYACQPRDGHRPDGHPAVILAPEAPLMVFLGEFVNTRLLGPGRADFLAASMADLDRDAGADHARRLAAFDRQIAEVSAKQQRLLCQAEDAESGDPFTTGLRRRYNDLDTQRRAVEHQRAALAADAPPPSADSAQALLAHLPIATLDLTGMPTEILRDLCEAFRITITYDRTTRQARYTAEIEAGTISHLRQRLTNPHVQICDVPPRGLEPPTHGLGSTLVLARCYKPVDLQRNPGRCVLVARKPCVAVHAVRLHGTPSGTVATASPGPAPSAAQ
jgi:site-specific DNA recombinase